MTTQLAPPAPPPTPLARQLAPARRWPRLADAGLAFGFFAAAALLRSWELLRVPRFTDEQLDTLYTLPLYRLQAAPIVGFDPYNGPLYSYLLAAAYWLIGPQPFTNRLLVMLIGAATVAATYLLGTRLAGRAAGLIAAGLMLTCANHVIVNSHVGWSNATTPFFTTLAFLAIWPAFSRGSGPWLALGGLAFAIALQTHPSVVAFLPGVGLALLLKRRELVFSRWAVLAGMLFLLGYSNIIAYNLMPKDSDPYRYAVSGLLADWRAPPENAISRLSHESEKNAEAPSGLAAFTTNFSQMVLNLPRVAGGLLESRPTWSDHLAQPTFWFYAALVAGGLLWPLRRGNPLPLLAGGSFLVLLAFLNGKYEPIFNGRYVMPILPLVFAGFGGLVVELWERSRGRLPRLAIGLVVLLLILQPLWQLRSYVNENAPNGQVNLDLVRTAGAVAEARRGGEPLLLDEALGRRNLAADGDLLMNLRVFLELRNVSYRVVSVQPSRFGAELGGGRSAVIVIAQPYPRPLDDSFRFTPIEETSIGRYAAYRVERK